jgi:hypothetical protein
VDGRRRRFRRLAVPLARLVTKTSGLLDPVRYRRAEFHGPRYRAQPVM